MKTKHAQTCKMAFGRFDMDCPRCKELANGAPARKGWHSRKADDIRRSAEIKAHNCQVSGAGRFAPSGIGKMNKLLKVLKFPIKLGSALWGALKHTIRIWPKRKAIHASQAHP